jgi:protein TonB
MSLAAAFAPIHSGESRRWTISIAVALALHAAGALFLLHLHAADTLHPPPAAPSMTFIDLQPLPAATPPVPASVPPPPEPPPPEPQPQPIAKPVVLPKPVVVHHVTPQVTKPVVQPQTAPTATAAVPAPAMSAPAAPTTPTVDQTTPRFTDLIAATLEHYKRYPAAAQKRGEQGVVMLRFTLDRGGNASNARIERSSGHSDLDDEVMALLRRAAPLPPIPADIAANTIDIVVPVSFAIH